MRRPILDVDEKDLVAGGKEEHARAIGDASRRLPRGMVESMEAVKKPPWRIDAEDMLARRADAGIEAIIGAHAMIAVTDCQSGVALVYGRSGNVEKAVDVAGRYSPGLASPKQISEKNGNVLVRIHRGSTLR